MTDAPIALRLAGVSKRFGGVQALDAVDFELRAGEIHCLAGENGCGKSTLIKIVTGVHAPDAGRVEVFGQPVARMTPDAARRAGLAVIWQDLALFPEMSVAENIAADTLVGGLRVVSHRGIARLAAAALERLGVSLDLAARLRTLPIAERQLVAIARALAQDARILFMDEPTASLTQSETDALLAIVRGLAARGVSVVFVSHRLAEVLGVCERVTVLRDGRLVGVFPTEGMTPSRLSELMTGQALAEGVAARDRASAPPVLEVEGLSRPGEFEDVSLAVREGEVVGIAGLIGAGRTELAETLFGLRRPARGTVRLDGRPVAFRSNREAIAAGVAYVPEDRLALGLIQPQSIADNLTMAVLRRLTGPTGLVSERARAGVVEHWVRDLGIRIGRPEDPVSSLSGGNQQRVVLGKWLATEPRLLILDSPTVGVDVGARAGIFRIVRALADQGLAILLISDEVPELHANADRVLHMRAGRIVGARDPRATPLAAMEAEVYA